MPFWHGEDRDILLLLRLSVLTGVHTICSEIITKRFLLFTQFTISTLLYLKLSILLSLIFINISSTNYLLINHLMCTTPDTEQIAILILHYLIIQKLVKYYLCKVIPIWNTLPNLLKNCTSKQFQINYRYIYIYMFPYLVLLILEFFPARLAMLLYGLD